MLEIRPSVEQDLQAIAEIRNSINPTPVTVDQLRAWDAHHRADTKTIFERVVAVSPSGEVVGYAHAESNSELPAGTWFISVGIRRSARRQGIGSQLLAVVEGYAQERGATQLQAYCRGEDDESFAWAQRRGYALDRQRTESVLDLTEFDRTRFTGHVQRVEASGLRFGSYFDRLPEDLLPEAYDWDLVTSPDIPAFEGNAPAFANWVRMINEDPTPCCHVYAFAGNRIAGGSVIYFPPAEGVTEAYTGYTAVRRDYRGRGIALAVKLLTIDEALRRGFTAMRTNNDPDNPAMLSVNTRLGYVLIPGPCRLKKPLGSQ